MSHQGKRLTAKRRETGTKGSPFSSLSKQADDFAKGVKKLSPETFADDQMKDFLKGKLRENQLVIWRSCLEAAIYCALFAEAKKAIKQQTARFRRVGPVVKYILDVMLPNGLFGPIVGFVFRLKYLS